MSRYVMFIDSWDIPLFGLIPRIFPVLHGFSMVFFHRFLDDSAAIFTGGIAPDQVPEIVTGFRVVLGIHRLSFQSDDRTQILMS